MSIVEFPASHPSTATVVRRAPGELLALCDDYWRLAQRISSTEFVPKAFYKRPEAVLAALLSGAERGLGPMESLRSIHVIEGRPTLSAEAMRALVFAAGHEIEIIETTAQRASVTGRRAGSETSSPPFVWTIDRAKRARLVGKQNWQAYPEAMLLARATADLCRALFPDVIAGLAVTEELLDDAEPAPATTTVRAAKPTRQRGAVAPVSPPVASIEATASDTAPEPVVPASEPTATGVPTTLPPMVDAEDGDTPYDEIPGSNVPSWATPADPDPEPAPTGPDKKKLERRIHASIAQAFPDADRATRDRYRHALVVLVTRDRDTGWITSSGELTTDEQVALSDVLQRVKAGNVAVTDEPGNVVAVRGQNGSLARITIEAGHVGIEISRASDFEPLDEASETGNDETKDAEP